jgi:hypothetical protein
MRRKFIRDHGRYSAGHVFDEPQRWWDQWFPGYEDFTVETDAVEVEKKPRRGRSPRKEMSDDARSSA